jgi:hypothetical protein
LEKAAQRSAVNRDDDDDDDDTNNNHRLREQVH